MKIAELISEIDIEKGCREIDRLRESEELSNIEIASDFSSKFDPTNINVSAKALYKAIPLIGRALYVAQAREEHKEAELVIAQNFVQSIASVAMTYETGITSVERLHLPVAYAMAQYFVSAEDLLEKVSLKPNLEEDEKVAGFCSEIFKLVEKHYLVKGSAKLATDAIRAIPIPFVGSIVANKIDNSVNGKRESISKSGSDLCSRQHITGLIEAYEKIYPTPEEARKRTVEPEVTWESLCASIKPLFLRFQSGSGRVMKPLFSESGNEEMRKKVWAYMLNGEELWYESRFLLWGCLVCSIFLIPIPLAFYAIRRTTKLTDKAKTNLRVALISWGCFALVANLLGGTTD